MPPVVETQGDLIADVIRKNPAGKSIEASQEFVDSWIATCNAIASVLLFSKVASELLRI